MTAHVTVPALHKWVTANASTNRHWRHRQGLVKAWRETAALHARAAARTPVKSPFAVTAVIYRADNRLYDLDGMSTVKACIDGLRDAGLIAGDDVRHMRRYTVEAAAPDPAHPRVELTIEETP